MMGDGYSAAGILAILAFIILNGCLYGFGAAIQNLSESSLEEKEEAGDKAAGRLLRIMRRPGGFIYTVQTVTHLSGMAVGALVLGCLGLKLMTMAAASVLLVVFLSLGIVVPKRCAVKNPERWAKMTYPAVMLMSIPAKPFAWASAGLSWLILKCLGVDAGGAREDVTEEEIMLMVNEGHEKGVLEASEAEMITNIFKLDGKEAGDIMTHRTALKALDGEMTLHDAISFIVNEGANSRYPVYEKDLDDIIGVLHIRDALTCSARGGQDSLPLKRVKGLLRPAHFIPETRGVDDLFEDMQSKKLHMAIVVDEYGQTAGIVTMEDILEEIVGNIQDEYDNEEELVSAMGNGVYIFGGMTPLEEVVRTLKIKLPREAEENYETLSGFLISLLGRIPGPEERGIEIPYGSFLFTVLRMENKIIGTVRVTAAPQASPVQ